MRLTVGRRTINVGHPDKLLFSDPDTTKRAFVEFQARIAETALPYLEGRPVAMKRYPDGVDGEGFFQKQAPDYFPAWIERAAIRKQDGVVHQVVIRHAADIVYLAEQACITPHAWLSRAGRLRQPDRMIFDLDPSADSLERIRQVARDLRDVLERVGLVPFVMTSGSRGYHIWVPLDGQADFDTAREFARDAARAAVARRRELATIEQRKSGRDGRVFIDYLRNAYAQTSVMPYSVRARPGAPVATPIEWDELGRIEPRSHTIRSIFRRLGQRTDPWRGMARHARQLAPARQRLDRLLDSA